jgi:[ribosomal protein S18]-alanine N-acetyltransferase
MPERLIELGLARQGEAAVLARMSRDLVETGLGWTYRTPRMSSLISDPAATALVAREPGRVVGFSIMRFGDERAHLVLLAVDPARRRLGIATRMLHWLVESAAVAGIASIHVELRVSNTAAHGLYESAGFAETFRVPGYYHGAEAAVRMIRLLRAPGIAVPAWQPPAVR